MSLPLVVIGLYFLLLQTPIMESFLPKSKSRFEYLIVAEDLEMLQRDFDLPFCHFMDLGVVAQVTSSFVVKYLLIHADMSLFRVHVMPSATC